MKTPRLLLAALLVLCLYEGVPAQSRWQYRLGLNFPAFGLPLHRPAENFRNLGFSAGLAYPLNQTESSALRFDLGFNTNRSQGNALYAQAQFSLHPCWGGKVETGFDIGLGYQLLRGAGPGLIRNVEGKWENTPNRHRALFVPFGLHLGYRVNQRWRPYVQYQVQALMGYNEAFPVFPANQFSIGQTFKF
jgi:hypothetical protein